MSEYGTLRRDGMVWRARKDFFPFLHGTFQEALSGAVPLKDRRAKAMYECTIQGRRYFVKVYRNRGFFYRLIRGPRALKELVLSKGLIERGISTVPVCAAGESKRQAIVVMEHWEGWMSLQNVMLSRTLSARGRRRLFFEYGVFCRKVHDAGVWQYDFNPSNVLVRLNSGSPEFVLVDLEQVRFRRIFSSERQRLLAKINRLKGPTRTDRLRFLKGYLKEQDERRPWIRRFLKQVKRQDKMDQARLWRNCIRENRNFGVFSEGEIHGYYRKKREGQEGLTREEVRVIAQKRGEVSGYRMMRYSNGTHSWREANLQAWAGGAAPQAVLIRKGGCEGVVIYHSFDGRATGA